ncbi:MAG: hypothetical protein HYZ28_19550 [Myxococcales bacterium]|nr:hypothetical protein [Myxococcales bacterium]
MGSNISELIQALKSRNTTRAAPEYIRGLIERAYAESARGSAPSQADLAQVQELLRSPGMTDGFNAELKKSIEGFVRGNLKAAPAPSVDQLTPDLTRLKNAQEVPARFASDFVVVRDQLIDRQGLTATEKASRAFEFFSRYAERFVTLAGESQRLGSQGNPDSQAAEKFLDVLKGAGFDQMTEIRTGRDALAVARALLMAGTPAEVARRASLQAFDAPSWESPRHYAPSAPASPRTEQRAVVSGLDARVPVQDAAAGAKLHERRAELLPVQGRTDLARVNAMAADAARASMRSVDAAPKREGPPWVKLLDRVRDKVLGPNLLWNFLHRYRKGADQDEDTAIGRDTIDKIAFGAAMVLLGIALLAILIVNL